MSLEEDLFVRHHQRPSKESLVALLKSHQNRVFNLCYQVLTHPEDAEDATQEVMIEAVRFLPRMKDAHSFKAWLYRVSLTTSLNLRKARARRAEMTRQIITGSTGASGMDRLERDAFMQAIADLDDDSRNLLVEHYFDKVTLEELGRREGISAAAIWKRLERAKERLKQALTGSGFASMAVDQTLEGLTPTSTAASLVTESVLSQAAFAAAGGAVMGTKSVLTGGAFLAAVLAAGIAGPTGYVIGARQTRLDPVTVQKEKTGHLESVEGENSHSIAPHQKSAAASTRSEPLGEKERVLALLGRLNGTRLRAASITEQLLEMSPDRVFEGLKEVWTKWAVVDRNLMLAALEEGGFSRIVDVLDLVMQDHTNEYGKKSALRILEGYAFRDFAAEGDYEAWHAGVAGKPLQEVLQDSAKSFVSRFEKAGPDEAVVLARALGRYVRNKRAVEATQQAGVLAVLEKHIARISAEQADDYLRVLRPFSLDEAYLRRVVIPWIEPETSDGNSTATALIMLGQPGNTWAIDVLMPYMQSGERRFVTWAAQGLAQIGDPRVIPAMITEINRDPKMKSQIGPELHKLTGVQYDPSHDGAWWADWWQKNQANYVQPK